MVLLCCYPVQGAVQGCDIELASAGLPALPFYWFLKGEDSHSAGLALVHQGVLIINNIFIVCVVMCLYELADGKEIP